MKESSLSVPITDLKTQYREIEDEVNSAVRRIMSAGQFILGPEVAVLESEVAAYCGTDYAVGVASGTDALRLALLACDVGPGDEVITTPFTFVATVETIVQCGAVPVFVDIDPGTCNMDVDGIEEKITPRTKAVLPVHLYGQSTDMDPVMELAKRYDLKIVEDCAQSLGAEYRGRKVGSIGDAGCLSFFPTKNLGAYGDGGMVITGNSAIAGAVKELRKHGSNGDGRYTHLGYNSRLDTLQAAVLRVKLKRLDSWIALRREKAGLYNGLLTEIDGLVPLYAEDFCKHAYNYYTVRFQAGAPQRDELRAHLSDRGIQTLVYYPLALHLQDAYSYLGYSRGSLPVTEEAQAQVLSLPMFPEITAEQINTVVDGVREFIESRRPESISL